VERVTDLLTAVQPAEDGPQDRPGSIARSAAVGAVWAAGFGLITITVAVLLAWAADSRSGASASAALSAAANGWLLAHGAPLAAAGSAFSLVPLGLTALPAYLLSRAGASVARGARIGDGRGAGAATGVLAACYAALAAGIAFLAGTAGLRVNPAAAGLAAGLTAGLFGGAGVLAGAGLWRAAWVRLSPVVRDALNGGAVAVAVVLAGGALVAGGALALSAGEAGRVFDALGPGLVGGVFLVLVSLAYLPNAVLWSAAFVVGPGFGVGVGTGVSLLDVRLRPVPALPMLAALPGGPVDRWLLALLALPVAGGLLAGALVARRPPAAGGGALWRLLGTAAATGPAAGALLGLLCLLARGSAGSGRLAAVGPSAWRVAGVLAVEVGLPAVGAAAWTAWWTARRASRQQ